MRLRFRRHCIARFILLALGMLAFAGDFALGQQDAKLQTRPNGLRPSDSQDFLKRSVPPENPGQPPVIDWNKREFGPSESAPKTDSLFVIGSSHTYLATSTDSTSPRFAAENIEELESFSPLALKIATASMSHVTPFFWWMAGPTSNLFVDETVERAPIEQKKTRIESRADSDALTSEPPKMIRIDETSSITSLVAQKNEANEHVDVVDNETTEEAPRKPAPRTVRIPFEKELEVKESVSKNNAASKQPMNRDPDSQRDQEEPQLDPRRGVNSRDQQGIDALLASKPGVHRREVPVDDPSNEGIKVAPIVQSKPLDPILAKQLQRTEACLTHYLDNPESTSVRSPWAVMHAVLAFGADYEMIHGKGRVNAIGWMCHNGTCRTQRMFTPKGKGFTPNVGDGVQGHEGQFLAILAQSNVPLNYPIQIGTSKFTVEDLVRYEMATCKEKSELTFKLIGLSYYLDSNKQWRASDGKQWSIQKLIQEELAQPIIGAACGGVHRLMGFSFSVRQRQLQAQPINGQYARAAKFVRDYVEYTWQMQNPDGSFSTNWYEGRGNEPKDERKVQTSGHMLEWLMYTMADEEIRNPRVGKAIDFLLSKIYDQRDYKWPIGPRGHATRAVALYQARTKEILNKPNSDVPFNSATKTEPEAIRK